LAIVAITGRAPRIKHGDTDIDPRAVVAATAKSLENVATVAAGVADDPNDVATAVRDAASDVTQLAVQSEPNTSTRRVYELLGASLYTSREERLFNQLPRGLQRRVLIGAGIDRDTVDSIMDHPFPLPPPAWSENDRSRMIAEMARVSALGEDFATRISSQGKRAGESDR
jgi:hypothetical protein